MNIFKRIFRIAGPGVVTGAADDDPSGIATYSQTGAQFGFGQLWTILLMLPMMIAIQEACARIGAINGKGITDVIKENYNQKILYLLTFFILLANTINIGADIGAMAAAANLIFHFNFYLFAFGFTILMVLLEIFFCYKSYAKILKWLCLSLFAYVFSVFIIKAPWLTVFKATFIPHVEFNFKFLIIIIGVFGTTISPYLFFWQAAQTVEDEREKGLLKRFGNLM